MKDSAKLTPRSCSISSWRLKWNCITKVVNFFAVHGGNFRQFVFWSNSYEISSVGSLLPDKAFKDTTGSELSDFVYDLFRDFNFFLSSHLRCVELNVLSG